MSVVSDVGRETSPSAARRTLMNIMLSISENTIMNCYLFSYSTCFYYFSCNYSRTYVIRALPLSDAEYLTIC